VIVMTYMDRVERVRYLKLAAEQIKENAESIVGTEDSLMSFDVTIRINPGEAPVIDVYKELRVKG